MDFKISSLKKTNKSNDKNKVMISTDLLEEILSMLRNVDCTCVWSEHDGQYIKVNDVDQSVVKDVEMVVKLANLK